MEILCYYAQIFKFMFSKENPDRIQNKGCIGFFMVLIIIISIWITVVFSIGVIGYIYSSYKYSDIYDIRTGFLFVNDTYYLKNPNAYCHLGENENLGFCIIEGFICILVVLFIFLIVFLVVNMIWCFGSEVTESFNSAQAMTDVLIDSEVNHKIK